MDSNCKNENNSNKIGNNYTYFDTMIKNKSSSKK